MNTGGRIPIRGTISFDRNQPPPPGPDYPPETLSRILVKRLCLRGFLFDEVKDLKAEYEAQAAGRIKVGKLRYREDIVDGLEAAPKAFLGLFQGHNFGNLVVRVVGSVE
jgi:NADPH-dependent curcumin reductase CurA